jgi:hypothetical protein
MSRQSFGLTYEDNYVPCGAMGTTGPTGPAPTDIDFTVFLTNKSNGSKTRLNFNAKVGSPEYFKISNLNYEFTHAYITKTVFVYDDCEYYVDSLE